MANEDDMQAPKLKNELNINTIIQIVGFLVLIAGGGAAWATALSAVAENSKDIGEHRIEIDKLKLEAAKMDNLAYRITVTEQGQLNQARVAEQQGQQMNSLQSDMRVVREILSRIEKKIDERTR